MKKIISTLLACLMLVNCFVFAVSSTETETETTIKQHYPLGENSRYNLDKALTAEPVTVEAVVAFPSSYAEVTDPTTGEKRPGIGGTIFGNIDGRDNSISFGIYKGQPVINWRDTGVKTTTSDDDIDVNITFDGVATTDVYDGQEHHIALVLDKEAEMAYCYIDGHQVDEQPIVGYIQSDLSRIDYDYSRVDEIKAYQPTHALKLKNFVLGGDWRMDNSRYFRGGTLSKVAVYSDIRTEAEIKEDLDNFGAADAALLVNFDLTTCGNVPASIPSTVGGYNAVKEFRWGKSAPRGDYAYSMAFLGDTQSIALNAIDNFHYMFDWLIANKESEKIEYVVGLGDITDKSTVEEWDTAVREYSRLDELYGANYMPIRGNHDYVTPVSGEKPIELLDGTIVTRAFRTYDQAFAGSGYNDSVAASTVIDGKATSGRMIETSLLNVFKTTNINGIPFLFISLDYGAPDTTKDAQGRTVLEWANDVVEAYPNHNVIVATHAYLDYDGEPLDADDKVTGDMNNKGMDIWNEFVSQHKNICLVVSGHIGYDYVVTSYNEGEKGNTVTQILSDHQSSDNIYISKNNFNDPPETRGLGMVTMLYFDGDLEGNVAKVSIETLSTVKALNNKDPYYWGNNQYPIEIQLNGTLYDITGDNETTVADMLYIVDDIINGTSKSIDVNCDGKISLADLLRVAKMTVK